MKHPFLLSRKIRKSIRDGVELLKHGAFTEQDVKVLLIDLRELAKYVNDRLSSETSEITRANKDFIEVCDFVAHASRDRGIVERIVRDHVRNAYPHFTPEEFAKVPVSGTINANRLVLSLAGLAFFGLSGDDPTLEADYVKELQERQSEIALCLLSLLQDAVIELKEDEGFGILQLMPHEGLYRLYCRVVNSRVEREARQSEGNEGQVLPFALHI